MEGNGKMVHGRPVTEEVIEERTSVAPSSEGFGQDRIRGLLPGCYCTGRVEIDRAANVDGSGPTREISMLLK